MFHDIEESPEQAMRRISGSASTSPWPSKEPQYTETRVDGHTVYEVPAPYITKERLKVTRTQTSVVLSATKVTYKSSKLVRNLNISPIGEIFAKNINFNVVIPVPITADVVGVALEYGVITVLVKTSTDDGEHIIEVQ